MSFLPFFGWGSSARFTHRDMESIQQECKNCKSKQEHTFRFYEKKAYMLIPLELAHHVTIICSKCHMETPIKGKQEQEFIVKFKRDILTSDGDSHFESGNYKNAIEKYDEVLKDDPQNVKSLYGKARSLIALENYSDAEWYVITLMQVNPKDKDILDLHAVLRKYLPLK